MLLPIPPALGLPVLEPEDLRRNVRSNFLGDDLGDNHPAPTIPPSNSLPGDLLVSVAQGSQQEELLNLGIKLGLAPF